MALDDIERWPNQTFAVQETLRLIGEGCKRILITSPTGGGKSVVVFDLAMHVLSEGFGVALFANRKLLIDQFARSLAGHGIPFGVRAAQHDDRPWEGFQVCSIQTEYSRVVKRKTRLPHGCGMFVVDEAHLNENASSKKVFAEYGKTGAVKVGVTATPLGLAGCYDELVQAGTTSELRGYGALVKAVHHGCTEPDLRNIGRFQVGEDLSDPQNVKAIMVPGIHGRVIEHFRRLNPDSLPSIGFAPGVPESVGFAEAFERAGIPAAHIDGEKIWVRGVEMPNTEVNREELLSLSRTSQVRVVWNRFVLREAVDMPWLRHGILATVFGSLQSYLQSGGRLLRSCPPVGKRLVVVQDHGGNWHRHGSLNADRIWRLTDTNRLMAQLRHDRITGDDGKEPREREPFLCPACGVVLNLAAVVRGERARCHACGHEFNFKRRSRPVLQANGELVLHQGPVYERKRVERKADTASKWEKLYWRARNGNMTFPQALGLFYHENGYYPPRDLPLMPTETLDWYLYVKDVPWDRLNPRTKGGKK